MFNVKTLVALSLAALFIGGVAGWLGHGMTVDPVLISDQPDDATQKSTDDDNHLSDEELSQRCEDLKREQDQAVSKLKGENAKTVMALQSKVKTLRTSLADKEAALEALQKASKKKSKKSGVKLSKASLKKLQAMEAEVATLRVQLAAATHERNSLKKELKKTLKDLDKQIVETKKYKKKARKYKRQSVDNLWRAFVAESKKAACVTTAFTQAGAQQKHDECSAAFEKVFGSKIRERFKTCAHSQAGMPIFKKKGWFEKMPPFSADLDPSGKNAYTKNYYIIFCDPTLPEKADSDIDLLKEETEASSKPAGLEDIEDEDNALNFELKDDSAKNQKKKVDLDDLDLDLDE